MRPKFRQWKPTTKAFHYWGYIDEDDTFTSPIHGNSQQFTGLLDRQGKEIYEGDIVKWSKGWMYPELIGTMEWIINGFYFICPLHDVKWHLGKDIDAEVIGNIYENPELLEGL